MGEVQLIYSPDRTGVIDTFDHLVAREKGHDEGIFIFMVWTGYVRVFPVTVNQGICLLSIQLGFENWLKLTEILEKYQKMKSISLPNNGLR